ncbi:MAG: putative DNA binding domain-containing protein [Deltaproteobacteria bacterium]|nr:putative DNA binding domain-containing protein [Deltaproteobacteria bacterium]
MDKPTTTIDSVLQWMKEGEGESSKFKQSLSTDLGKTIVAFGNTNGGVILIGVDDEGQLVGLKGKNVLQDISDAIAGVVPAPKVSVEEVAFGDRKVAIIHVEKGAHLYSCRNVVYIRVGRNNRPLSIQEVIEKGSESLRIFFDEMPSQANIAAIDKKLVKKFLKVREEVRGVRHPTLSEDRQLQLLRILKSGKNQLTQGGLLFFGRDPQKWIPQARVHCVHFLDDEMQRYTNQRFFEGSLWLMMEEIETYLRSHLQRSGGQKTGFRRLEKFEYPLEAIREALLNAMIHRNYFSAADIKMFFFPNRLLIRNPGSFPPGVTPELPEHRPRNPLLAQFFYDVGLVEKYGSGIETMRRLCGDTASVTLSFDLRESSTTLIFQKKEGTVQRDLLDEKILKRLEQGAARSAELVSLTGISRQAVTKRLNRLLVAGTIRREGSGAGVVYYQS